MNNLEHFPGENIKREAIKWSLRAATSDPKCLWFEVRKLTHKTEPNLHITIFTEDVEDKIIFYCSPRNSQRVILYYSNDIKIPDPLPRVYCLAPVLLEPSCSHY